MNHSYILGIQISGEILEKQEIVSIGCFLISIREAQSLVFIQAVVTNREWDITADRVQEMTIALAVVIATDRTAVTAGDHRTVTADATRGLRVVRTRIAVGEFSRFRLDVSAQTRRKDCSTKSPRAFPKRCSLPAERSAFWPTR